MLTIKDYPSNKEQFTRLVEFYKEIIGVCEEQNVEPILYGSLAVFIYTKDSTMNVNDVDLLVKENNFLKIIKTLEKRKINFNHDKTWHVLQIMKDDLKIELDSIDFWQKGLALDLEELDFYGKTVNMVSLSILKNIYKKASKVSQDNPSGNKKKYDALSKVA